MCLSPWLGARNVAGISAEPPSRLSDVWWQWGSIDDWFSPLAGRFFGGSGEKRGPFSSSGSGDGSRAKTKASPRAKKGRAGAEGVRGTRSRSAFWRVPEGKIIRGHIICWENLRFDHFHTQNPCAYIFVGGVTTCNNFVFKQFHDPLLDVGSR